MPMLGRCMIFKKFQVWRNARTCIKCSSWIVKEDGQEQHLKCKPNSCFFSLAIYACHFLWLDEFLWLARVSSYRREKKKSASMWDREIEKNSTVWKVEKKKKKNKVLDCMKPGYYKEVLDFSNIKYYIMFLIIQIPVSNVTLATH